MCACEPATEFLALTPHNVLLLQGDISGEAAMGVKERNLHIMLQVATFLERCLSGPNVTKVMTDEGKKKLIEHSEQLDEIYKKYSETLYQGKGIALVVLRFGKDVDNSGLESAAISFHDGRSISVIFNKENGKTDTKAMVDRPELTVKLDSVMDLLEHGSQFMLNHYNGVQKLILGKIKRFKMIKVDSEKILKELIRVLATLRKNGDDYYERKKQEVDKYCEVHKDCVTTLESKIIELSTELKGIMPDDHEENIQESKKLGKEFNDNALKAIVFEVSQQIDRFSNRRCDEQEVKFCWSCYVEVGGLQRSLCAGCKTARYCTIECQGYDWVRHQEFCKKKSEKRIKK